MPVKVFDFFSGCGGTSTGFMNAGMDIVFALDNDSDAATTFQHNFPETHFLQQNITEVDVQYLQPFIDQCGNDPLLFCGCAPCQPFTKQNTVKPIRDVRISLLDEFRRFVEFYNPEYVFVENVPGIQKIKNNQNHFNNFVRYLRRNCYSVIHDIIASQSYGVPQQRRRLVMLASRVGEIELPAKTHGPGTENENYSSVREWIEALPPIQAGEEHLEVPNHRASGLSPKNLERIRSIGEGEGRNQWPKHLVNKCHNGKYEGHTDVYGRMRWDFPSTGLTTRCISLSNGRFGHPEQDRAISVREAALLQTFPNDFIFYGSLASMARQIGNAVPVLLAETFGHHINNHIEMNQPERL